MPTQYHPWRLPLQLQEVLPKKDHEKLASARQATDIWGSSELSPHLFISFKTLSAITFDPAFGF